MEGFPGQRFRWATFRVKFRGVNAGVAQDGAVFKDHRIPVYHPDHFHPPAGKGQGGAEQDQA